jgi:hypothetical protein
MQLNPLTEKPAQGDKQQHESHQQRGKLPEQ